MSRIKSNFMNNKRIQSLGDIQNCNLINEHKTPNKMVIQHILTYS